MYRCTLQDIVPKKSTMGPDPLMESLRGSRNIPFWLLHVPRGWDSKIGRQDYPLYEIAIHVPFIFFISLDVYSPRTKVFFFKKIQNK